jgi:hypothetical protein
LVLVEHTLPLDSPPREDAPYASLRFLETTLTSPDTPIPGLLHHLFCRLALPHAWLRKGPDSTAGLIWTPHQRLFQHSPDEDFNGFLDWTAGVLEAMRWPSPRPPHSAHEHLTCAPHAALLAPYLPFSSVP